MGRKLETLSKSFGIEAFTLCHKSPPPREVGVGQLHEYPALSKESVIQWQEAAERQQEVLQNTIKNILMKKFMKKMHK